MLILKIASLISISLFGNKIRIKKNNNKNFDSFFCKKTNIDIKGANNTLSISKFSKLSNCEIKIVGNNNNIVIGENVSLKHTNIYIEDDGNSIFIGDNCTFHGLTQISAIEGTSVNIGYDCMFSQDIHIRTGDSHSIINKFDERINLSKDIFIGNHVWVGTKVIFLKGVEVADNCIVGANSLLNKKYKENNIIIAGNPAAVVKKEVNWLRERV